METISKQQMQTILANAPTGVDRKKIIDGLIQRGYNIEGVDNNAIRQTLNVQKQEATTPSSDMPVLQQVGAGIVKGAGKTVLGAGEIGQDIAQGTVGKLITPISNVLRRALGKDEITEEDVQRITSSPIFQEGTEENERLREILATSTPAEKAGEIVGDVATFAVPGGAVARTARGASRLARTAGQAITSSGVATAQEGEIGKDTLIAGATELGIPLLGKVLSTTFKGLGWVGQEVLGSLSGTSQETLKVGLEESLKSPKGRQIFVRALRNESTPEEIALNLRQNIEQISQQRSADYANSLNTLGTETVSTSGIADNFIKSISDSYGVRVDNNGMLDFTKSRLRTSPQAQSKLQEAYSELRTLQNKGSTTIQDIDITRQAVQDIALKGEDASARTANSLITKAVNSIRKKGEQVKGYKEMLQNFSASKAFTDEIEKGLASGSKKTIDQTFRTMVTAFKTNNEQRMALLRELDDITDGFVSAQITGQQLSELLPRGMVGRLLTPFIAGGAITGGISAGFAPTLLLASPRVIGEIINSLALGAEKTKILKKSFSQAQKILADSLGVRKQDLINSFLINKTNED